MDDYKKVLQRMPWICQQTNDNIVRTHKDFATMPDDEICKNAFKSACEQAFEDPRLVEIALEAFDADAFGLPFSAIFAHVAQRAFYIAKDRAREIVYKGLKDGSITNPYEAHREKTKELYMGVVEFALDHNFDGLADPLL